MIWISVFAELVFEHAAQMHGRYRVAGSGGPVANADAGVADTYDARRVGAGGRGNDREREEKEDAKERVQDVSVSPTPAVASADVSFNGHNLLIEMFAAAQATRTDVFPIEDMCLS